MFKELKKDSTLIRILIVMAIAALGIYLFGVIREFIGNFSDIIIVVVTAWVLSLILEPVVSKINSLTRLPKIISALLTYVSLFAIISAVTFLFIPAIGNQIKALSEIAPKYLANAPGFINRWTELALSFLSDSVSLTLSIAQFFFSFFIVLILSFYFVMDKERISREIISLTPKNWHKLIKFTENAIDEAFASFVRIQIIFGIMSGIITWIILRILNVDFAASVAFLAGVFTVIPLVGPILAVVPPVFVAFIMDPAKAVIVLIALLVSQQLIFNIIGSKLLSRAFKLHPAVVLISFLVGFKIGGGVGAIFAVPVLSIILIVTREIIRQILDKPKE